MTAQTVKFFQMGLDFYIQLFLLYFAGIDFPLFEHRACTTMHYSFASEVHEKDHSAFANKRWGE